MLLKDLRIKRGKTSREVREAVGVSKQAYWYYETGKRDIPQYLIPKLAKVLGATVEQVLLCSKSNQNVHKGQKRRASQG